MEEIYEKINYYYEVVETFMAVLKEENQALRDYNMSVIQSLCERKAKSVNAYRMLIAFFIKNQEPLKNLNKETKDDLRQISAELDVLLKENECLLKARMETSKNVMDTIVNLAKINNNANATSYGRSGSYAPQDRSRNALAVNRTL
jgi:hypothetical protein